MRISRRFIVVGLWALLSPTLALAQEPVGSIPQCHDDHGLNKIQDKSNAAERAAADSEVWPAMVQGPIVDRDSIAPNGNRIKTLIFKDMLVDKIYPSMRGPWTRKYVQLFPEGGKTLWIKHYRAEVLDGATGSASQEYMCHTNMDMASNEGTSRAFIRERSWLSISQGQKEVTFPKGFGLRIPNTTNYITDINVMVLNNNETPIHRKLDFKVTVGFVDEATGLRERLIPLVQTSLSVECPTEATPENKGIGLCEPASKFLVMNTQDKATGHWLVPPGRHWYRFALKNIVPKDTTLHYIWMHVHPYAESVELRDKTIDQTVWKGHVKSASNRAAVLSTEKYSSTKGLPLFRDHEYEVIATYNNTTSHKIDSMASFWMYYQEPS